MISDRPGGDRNPMLQMKKIRQSEPWPGVFGLHVLRVSASQEDSRCGGSLEVAEFGFHPAAGFQLLLLASQGA